MKSFRILMTTTVIAAALGIAQPAAAATDGTLGATSTGTAVVTLTIAEQFKISNMNDLPLGAYGGSGNMTGNDNICVYSNGDGTYKVTITDDSSLSASDFSVQDTTDTRDIAMQVRFNDQSGTSGNVAATFGTAIASTGANTVSQDCSSGGLTANLQVTLLQAALQAAPAGTYDSTITLLVEAD